MADARIYLSGPITGTDDAAERFAAAEEKVTKWWGSLGLATVLNPMKMSEAYPGLDRQTYMALDHALLSSANVVVMLKGWPSSSGCRQEFDWARAEHKTVFVENRSGFTLARIYPKEGE